LGCAKILVPVLCVAFLLSQSYHPIYDGAPNNGDETMSLTQAMNSFRQRSPAYGYTGTTSPWTPGLFVLPGYFLVYGPVISAVSPLKRLPVARICSRVVSGFALSFCLFLLWRAHQNRSVRSWFGYTSLVLFAAGVIWIFARTESFLYVASFGRVDAVGMLSVCAFQVLAARFLEQPGQGRLTSLGFMVAGAFSCSPLAGALCAFEATVLASWYLLCPFRRRKVLEVSRALTLVVGVTLAVFLLITFLVLHRPVRSPANVALHTEVSVVVNHVLNPTRLNLSAFMLDYPGLFWATSYVFLGAVILGSIAGRVRAVLIIGRLAATIFAACLFAAFHRMCYFPLFLLAVLLPILDQWLRFAPPKWLSVAFQIAFLVLVVSRISGSLPDQARDLRRAQANNRRDDHIRSVTHFLDLEGVKAALVTDPMFTLLDSDTRRYYFIYEPVPPGELEYEILENFLHKYGASYLVTTDFGRSGWVSSLGMPTVNKVTPPHSIPSDAWFEVHYPRAGTLFLRCVFVSAATGDDPGSDYQYGDRPSTPIAVYQIRPGNRSPAISPDAEVSNGH
jgi:hypothetical protein